MDKQRPHPVLALLDSLFSKFLLVGLFIITVLTTVFNVLIFVPFSAVLGSAIACISRIMHSTFTTSSSPQSVYIDSERIELISQGTKLSWEFGSEDAKVIGPLRPIIQKHGNHVSIQFGDQSCKWKYKN